MLIFKTKDGLYVYSFQGQFTLPVAFQGVSKYSWQTVGNVLSLISGILAGGLYGNIGKYLLKFHVNQIVNSEYCFRSQGPLRQLGGRFLQRARPFDFEGQNHVESTSGCVLDRRVHYWRGDSTGPNPLRNGSVIRPV